MALPKSPKIYTKLIFLIKSLSIRWRVPEGLSWKPFTKGLGNQDQSPMMCICSPDSLCAQYKCGLQSLSTCNPEMILSLHWWLKLIIVIWYMPIQHGMTSQTEVVFLTRTPEMPYVPVILLPIAAAKWRGWLLLFLLCASRRVLSVG